MTLNDWYSFCQVASVVAGLFAFASLAGTVITGLRVNEASSLQIADLQKQAADARTETERIKAAAAESQQESDEKIASLRRDTASLTKDADKFRSDIAQAQLATMEARRRQEELYRGNLEAFRNLETERQKRLSLASSLLPRDFRDQSTAVNSLQRFPKMMATIRYLDEREARMMAEQINFVLSFLHWQTTGVPAHDIDDVDFRNEGISITPGSAPFPETAPKPESFTAKLLEINQRETEGAALALRDALLNSAIEAVVHPADTKTPVYTLIIEVGSKPNRALEDTVKELGPQQQPVRGALGSQIGSSRLAFPKLLP
jgi:hypothetical protein